ncbi:MAG: T9SS type A sorting domain-containing protein [Bacteroidales bacterium]|nr:T9SS type A sorting domain-containing protein [Bacteroidales bacterium]
MKKTTLFLMMCIASLGLSAQVFVENFTGTPGSNVEGYNGWYVSAKAADALGVSPVIAEGALFYNNYYGSNIGNVAVLDSAIGVTSANQRISTHSIIFANADTLKPIAGQKIYAAFMVNFSSHSYRSYRDFFTYEGSTTSSSTRGRLFAKLNTAGTDVTFAISKNSSTAGVYIESQPLVNGVGVNHLLVFTYEGVDGTDNDYNTLYIDPDLTLPEAQQTNKLVTTDVATDYSASITMRINLRQRGTGAQIGGIRVGRSWNEVLLGTTAIKGIQADNGQIFVSGKSILTNAAGKLSIYNIRGMEVMTSTTEGKIDTQLNNGLYLVRFVDKNGKTSSAKVVLN